jgi:hypothetical protein
MGESYFQALHFRDKQQTYSAALFEYIVKDLMPDSSNSY